jgi:hypothetical protein
VVAGGVLVYEPTPAGKELIGYESVTDWSQLGDAVATRGHDRGDALHLPVLDEQRHERTCRSASLGTQVWSAVVTGHPENTTILCRPAPATREDYRHTKTVS